MIAAIQTWFAGLTMRERWLVGVAATLAALLFAIFVLILPMQAAIDQAEAGHDEAVARRGRIEALVASVGKATAKPQVAVVDANLLVTQGAAEKGFDLITTSGDVPGQVTFRIDQARTPALLVWLSELEAQGIDTRTINMRSSASGIVTVEAQLQGRGR